LVGKGLVCSTDGTVDASHCFVTTSYFQKSLLPGVHVCNLIFVTT